MSFFNDIYGGRELSARAKTVCLYLHDRANGDGESWYAIGTIARDLTLSRSTVKRALNDLVRLGRVEMRADGKTASPPRGGCASQLDLGLGHSGPLRIPQGKELAISRGSLN